MEFLADESFDFRLVRALRAAGHSVTSVLETRPEADDATVIRLAAESGRVLLTKDKDFGWLVYVSQSASPGCGPGALLGGRSRHFCRQAGRSYSVECIGAAGIIRRCDAGKGTILQAAQAGRMIGGVAPHRP